jgi:pimeloyl-ACP methyl ester carboxylesterase
VVVPALYIAGERDIVLDFLGVRQRIPDMSKSVPQLRRTIMLPDCGHWTQQEAPSLGLRRDDRLHPAFVLNPQTSPRAPKTPKRLPGSWKPAGQ